MGGREEGRKDSGDEILAAGSCVVIFSVEISTWKYESFEGLENRGFRERILQSWQFELDCSSVWTNFC